MKASQKGQFSLWYCLKWSQQHSKRKIDSVNSHFVLFFSQHNFSKLKASCDVKATKGSKRNLNLLQIPTFDFDKNIHFPSYFFT